MSVDKWAYCEECDDRDCPEDCDECDFADEVKFVLTEEACMHETLKDFGFDVSLPMAKAIMNRFIELMVSAGHMRRTDGVNCESEG